MIATALSSYFVLGAIYWFPAMPGSCCFVPGATYYFRKWPRPLLPIRVHNDSIPIVFVQFSLAFIIWASSLTLIFFRLCRNHLFLTSGLSLPAKYLGKVHMEEKT